MNSIVSLQNLTARPKLWRPAPGDGLLLQRKCACGSPAPSLTGECAQCQSSKLVQARLAMGASSDPLEKEADRVADQVLAAPAHAAVSATPPHLQRFTDQAGAPGALAPASVDRVLASTGRPLELALQQDMAQRFRHDFSGVRVHDGEAAGQSAREVSANAYTVGRHIVFGANRFAPATPAGRRLIAHELAHVVQQTAPATRAPQATLQRDEDPDAQDAWEKLSADTRKKAQSLYEDCTDLIGRLGDAQDAHFSSLRRDWINFLGQNLLVRINKLDSDSKLRGLANIMQDFKDGISRNVAQFDTEWQALEQRYLDEHRWLLTQHSTDATQAAKRIEDLYNDSKHWLDQGAMPYITDEDYLLLKDTLEKGKHISVGVLRSSRIRAKMFKEMLDTVAELRRAGEDADKFVPGWSIQVDQEAANLARLANSTAPTTGTDYPAEFLSMRKELLEKKKEAMRAHKREKSVLEKGVDLVSGGVEALVGPFIEAARQVIDLSQIVLHFASFGKYEPKFVSDMAKAAEQGATTGDLLKGMVTGLLETPERFMKAVADGDWEAIGREAVNIYMLAKTIKEAPELIKKLPEVLAKTTKALRILKARRVALELNEPRLVTQAPMTPVPTPGLALPKEPAILRDPPAPVTPAKKQIGFKPADTPAPASTPAATPARKQIGFRRSGDAPSTPVPDVPPKLSPSVGGFGRDSMPAAPSGTSSHGPTADMPPARDVPGSSARDSGPTAQRRDQPAKAMADKAGDKLADPQKQPVSDKSSTAAKPAGKAAGSDTVPAGKLRQDLRNQLEARVKRAEARATEFRREVGKVEGEIKAINEKIKSAATKAERDQLQSERQKLIDDRVNLGTGEDFGAQVAEAKRLLRGTEKDYFDALSSAASKKPEYTAVKGRKIDEVFQRKGALEVEHIYPRSRIFNTPGFEKLMWEDQIALFNYEPNLRFISAEINLARSNIPYASWSRSAWSRFPEITEAIIADLAKIENAMQVKFDAMIKNPSTIPRKGV